MVLLLTTPGKSGRPVLDTYNNVLGIIIFGLETIDIYKKADKNNIQSFHVFKLYNTNL